jgi:hypothetical protein
MALNPDRDKFAQCVKQMEHCGLGLCIAWNHIYSRGSITVPIGRFCSFLGNKAKVRTVSPLAEEDARSIASQRRGRVLTQKPIRHQKKVGPV